MPEGLEAEIWCRAAQPLTGRTIESLVADERVAPVGLAGALVGATVTGVRRRGKVLLFELGEPGSAHPSADRSERVLGRHFGMSGRLVVDGRAPIEQLSYASGQDRPEWDRLQIWTGSGTTPALRFNDPRRLGRVTLDPDLTALGPDMFDVSLSELGEKLARRTAAIKTVLLDQHVIAGLGNLCTDEVLWWSGVDPHRSAASLVPTEVSAVLDAIQEVLPVMLEAGGSTRGTLTPEVRAACPPCERDGTPLRRDTIGGRTTVWCPHHQR